MFNFLVGSQRTTSGLFGMVFMNERQDAGYTVISLGSKAESELIQ